MDINKVIITGASGPLGVMMIRECIERDIEVLALVRPDSKKTGDIPIHPLVTVFETDITEINSLHDSRFMDSDVLFHFAWMHTSDGQRDNPILQERNIAATLMTAEFAKRVGCKAFIGTGSQAEYGIVNHIADEMTPANPITMYGITKLAAGKLLMEYCRQNTLRCNWVRIFSVYGPYENDYVFTSYLIRTLLKGEEPLLTPCEQTWDYLYCKDAVNALLLVAEKSEQSEVYCLGGGHAGMLKDYVTATRDCINDKLTIGFGKRAYSDNQIMHLEADISKLKRDTGFEPKYSFEEGISETIEWYRKGCIGG